MDDVKRKAIQDRLEFRRTVLKQLYEAYKKISSGAVKSYMIDDRQLTRFDLPDLKNEIEECEQKIDELSAALEGKRSRKAFGIIPRDW